MAELSLLLCISVYPGNLGKVNVKASFCILKGLFLCLLTCYNFIKRMYEKEAALCFR